MNERQMQFRVGVVVFATMIIGGLLATLSGPLTTSWLPWGPSNTSVGIKVDKAPGVDQNTPVRKNGILIGRVKSIEEQAGGMLLKAEINSNRPLYADYEPHIRTTVIGDATIDFVSNSRPARGATRGGRDGVSRARGSESVRFARPIGRFEGRVRGGEPLARASGR